MLDRSSMISSENRCPLFGIMLARWSMISSENRYLLFGIMLLLRCVAGGLVERLLVDRDADVLFDLRDVLRIEILGHAGAQRVGDLLGVGSGRIERRDLHVGDDEHDALGRLLALRALRG